MADTERSINNLLTALFQDGQAAGAITPQDIRDAIVSLAQSYGDCYISSSAATVIAGVDTWTKVLGTTTAGSNLRDVSMSASNRLRNDSDNTRIYKVTATLEVVCAGSAKQLGFGFAVDGTIDANTEISYLHVTAATEQAITITALLSLAATSYVEVFAVNRTDGVDLTVQKMVFHAIGLAT